MSLALASTLWTLIRSRQSPNSTGQRRRRSCAACWVCATARDYVPRFSDVVFPLTQLTSKRVPNNIPWGSDEQVAFDAGKHSLARGPALYAPDLGHEFVVATDASDNAVGACLSQCDDAGSKNPIAFLSTKLTPTQQRWSTIEREAYTVV